MVSLPEKLAALRMSDEKHIPGPVRGMALVDTGAYTSAIDVAVFQHLSILAIDRRPIHSAGGNVMAEIFPANLSFPELNVPTLEMEQVIGCNFGWKGRKDDEFLMVLGRDFLKNFLVVYDGMHGEWLLGH
jgi:hypothetical protein